MGSDDACGLLCHLLASAEGTKLQSEVAPEHPVQERSIESMQELQGTVRSITWRLRPAPPSMPTCRDPDRCKRRGLQEGQCEPEGGSCWVTACPRQPRKMVGVGMSSCGRATLGGQRH